MLTLESKLLSEQVAKLAALKRNITPEALLRIHKELGGQFFNQISVAHANEGQRKEQAMTYITCVMWVFSSEKKLREFGLSAPMRDLVTTALQQPDRTVSAIRSLQNADTFNSGKAELLRIFEADDPPLPNFAAPERAMSPNPTQKPSQPATPRADAKPPQERTTSENKANWRSVHIYGGKAAFCFSLCEVRGGGSYSVMVDGALASGTREYDWAKKISLQLSSKELLQVLAVLRRRVKVAELSAHGEANDKGFKIEDQGDKFFMSLNKKGEPSRATPMPMIESFEVISLLLLAIRKNHEHLSTVDILNMHALVFPVSPANGA